MAELIAEPSRAGIPRGEPPEEIIEEAIALSRAVLETLLAARKSGQISFLYNRLQESKEL
jgi:hypothetical protein